MSDGRISQLGKRIIEASRNQVYFQLQYLEQALFYLNPVEREYAVMGNDGRNLYYNSDYVIKQFLKNPCEVECDFLHTILHCLYRHPWQGGVQQEYVYWNIAADIAVTDVMGEMDLPQVREVIPQKCFDITAQIRGEVPIMSAQQIERYLKENEAQLMMKHGMGLEEMESLFYRDDHSMWRVNQKGPQGREQPQMTQEQQRQRELQGQQFCSKSTEESGGGKGGMAAGNSMEAGSSMAAGSSAEDDWSDIAEATMQNALGFSHGRGTMPGSMMQVLQRLTRESYDYADFLRKFARLNECMKLDLDEFDYLYYIYGLNYMNANVIMADSGGGENRWEPCQIAMIEPLEYKEEYRVRDFVIAIDTSGSCSGESVRKFLNKTYNILKSTENFTDKVVIHIIQCDSKIQEDTRIEDLSELENYMAQMKIKGLGGTDFVPVFDYVDELCAGKEFNNLGGLIYFTDGIGTYPKHPPKYKTAFVFIGREDQVQVPPWAMKVYLDD